MLDHPRRVYTNLFPSHHTLWLLISLLTLTAIDWIAFEMLNINNVALDPISVAVRVACGLFQAISNRSAGFDILSITRLAIGLQVLCLVMMYISIYPIAITVRSSNEYQERSLGIFARDTATPQEPSRLSFVRQQLRLQLAHDLWWIALSTLVIICIETQNYAKDPITYSVFNVIFEVVSAYGPVGLSTGLPNQSYSLSGGWHKGSKVVLCMVMIRGRHRGLPVGIDSAVLLPGEEIDLDDD
jgi:Trk-type K+ transport system membrane component